MIRHSKSLFASLFLHSVLVIIIFAVWQNWPETQKEEEEKICLKMCHVQEPQIIPQKKQPIIEKPKVLAPPPPKKVEKPKPKKKPKKKIVKKKIKPKPKKKTVPIIKKVLKEPIEPEIVEKKAEHIVTPVVVEKIPQQVVKKAPQESQAQKEKRLEENYLDEHIQEIVKLLRNNLYYPRSARKRGITGKVIVKFKLLTNGDVEYLKVVSFKSEILKRAAIKTIDNLSGEFPKPQEELLLHVPIVYSLKN